MKSSYLKSCCQLTVTHPRPVQLLSSVGFVLEQTSSFCEEEGMIFIFLFFICIIQYSKILQVFLFGFLVGTFIFNIISMLK